MKRILVLLICIILVGCGKEDNITELNLEKTTAIIENKLDNMVDVDENVLVGTYELDLSLMDEYVIKQNMNGDLYAVIKTNDKKKMKSNMDVYFDKIRTFNTAYSPERLEILDNRLEKEIGNYLIYIVSENADDIYEEIINSLE